MDTATATRLNDVTSRSNRIDLESKDFVKYLASFAVCHGDQEEACRHFLEHFPGAFGKEAVKRQQKDLELTTKAATLPGTTTDGSWAKPLVGVSMLADGFLALARAESLLARIPGLRRVPFNVRIPTQSQAAAYAWVAQGEGKPVSTMAFAAGVVLEHLKAVGINVYTSELVRSIGDGTEAALRDSLIDGLTEFQDTSFLDPTKAAIVGKQPASITNGRTPVVGTGNLQADLDALFAAFYAARPNAKKVSLICNALNAWRIVPVTGWSCHSEGTPVIVSGAAGANIILVDASAIFYSDGGIELDVSTHAAFEQNSTPTSPPTASTIVTSLWQENLIGLRVERFLNWFAHPTAVAYLVPGPPA